LQCRELDLDASQIVLDHRRVFVKVVTRLAGFLVVVLSLDYHPVVSQPVYLRLSTFVEPLHVLDSAESRQLLAHSCLYLSVPEQLLPCLPGIPYQLALQQLLLGDVPRSLVLALQVAKVIVAAGLALVVQV
jgi:hypothetical protein